MTVYSSVAVKGLNDIFSSKQILYLVFCNNKIAYSQIIYNVSLMKSEKIIVYFTA